MKPEEHQPSGTCNFSRLDSCDLIFHNLHLDPSSEDVENYNKKWPDRLDSSYPDDYVGLNHGASGLELKNQITAQYDDDVSSSSVKSVINSRIGGHSNLPNQSNMKVYAINHNVLRIMSGMGGLAYSN